MKLDKVSGGVRVMSELAAEMKASIIILAGERSWGETRQRWLERAARQASISYRSAKSLFYVEDHEPRASTVERVRRAAAAQRDREASGVDEYRELRARLDKIEARLRAEDQNMDRQGDHLDGG